MQCQQTKRRAFEQMKKIRLTEADLRKLTTQRLLKYRDSLLACHETEDDDTYRKKVIKSSDEWREHYVLVKSILSTREHVRKKECF